MKIASLLSALALTFAIALPATAGETPSAAGVKYYFVNLKDGDTVSSPVKVVFGLAGMGVAPAGVEKENTGHHHILLNRAEFGKGPDGADELTDPVAADDNNIHFGKGQTETMLKLEPGKHTIQLVLGDHNHVPHNPPVVSDRITITVK